MSRFLPEATSPFLLYPSKIIILLHPVSISNAVDKFKAYNDLLLYILNAIYMVLNYSMCQKPELKVLASYFLPNFATSSSSSPVSDQPFIKKQKNKPLHMF